MKKLFCLLLVLCTLLSCMSMGVSATGRYPNYGGVFDYNDIFGNINGSQDNPWYDGSYGDIVGGDYNGGTIRLQVGESEQLSLDLSDMVSSIRAQGYTGMLQSSTKVTISNANVAKANMTSESGTYVAWKVTGVSAGEASMSVSTSITTECGDVVGSQSASYTIIVEGCQMELPNIPVLEIYDDKSNEVTGGEVSVKVGGSLKLELRASEYKAGFGNDYGHDDRCNDSAWYEGGYYYVDESSVTWSAQNTKYVKIGSRGTTATISGVEPGEVVVTVSAYVGYMYPDGNRYSDSGSKTKISANVTVVVEDGFVNPFADIDPDTVENPFSDVSKDDWSYDYIMLMYAAGMYDYVDFMDGATVENVSATAPSYGLFKLGNLAGTANLHNLAGKAKARKLDKAAYESRGNTVASMYHLDTNPGSYTKNPFKDLPAGAPYYNPVLWAYNKDVVNGYGKGKFGPNNYITREQMCAILVRLSNTLGVTIPSVKSPKTFKDAGSISAYARDAVDICQRAGIISGRGGGIFDPAAPIQRQEVAKMIVQFASKVS